LLLPLLLLLLLPLFLPWVGMYRPVSFMERPEEEEDEEKEEDLTVPFGLALLLPLLLATIFV
jgi:hypothetical protein